MPSRRSHTKSHHGCAQCKARRVKCDETLPECQRCIRRQMRCSFMDNDSSANAPTTFINFTAEPTTSQFVDQSRPTRVAAPTAAASPLKHEATPSIPTPNSIPDFSSQHVVHSPPVPKRSFSLTEVELIHHYSTKTYITITSRLTSHMVWRDVIFREALRHPFLLDALMATSALHKASGEARSTEAHSDYHNRALGYQTAALSGYIPAMNSPTKDNSIALVAMSVLLPVWSFGSIRVPQRLGSDQIGSSPLTTVQDRVLSLMQLTQGINAIMAQTDPSWLEELTELLISPADDDLPPLTKEVERSLDLLAQRINDEYKAHRLKSESATEVHELYLERVQSLRRVARMRAMLEWDANIFSWPVTVKPLFMELLRRHDPIALALFVFWAACFRAMDHLWWAKGWGYRLVQDVSSLLDSSWDQVLEWPKSEVGFGYQGGSGSNAGGNA